MSACTLFLACLRIPPGMAGIEPRGHYTAPLEKKDSPGAEGTLEDALGGNERNGFSLLECT